MAGSTKQLMSRPGLLIVISGPSATGKGTICKYLLENNKSLHYSISVTTRQPRTGELDGVNYWFTTQDNFLDMAKNGELLEWAEVYGNYYGTPRRYVDEMLESGKDVVLEIDPQGAMQIKAQYPKGVFIYIVPPSMSELAMRINKRAQDTPEAIKKRLMAAYEEMSYADQYDYIVVNDKVDVAASKISAVVVAEKCRVERNADMVKAICESGNAAQS